MSTTSLSRDDTRSLRFPRYVTSRSLDGAWGHPYWNIRHVDGVVRRTVWCAADDDSTSINDGQLRVSFLSLLGRLVSRFVWDISLDCLVAVGAKAAADW
eukprot:scaffold73526_cov35-Attheya_sp.AAC.1